MGSAATMIAPSIFSIQVTAKNNMSLNYGLLPFFIFEDCVKLINASPEINADVRNALAGDIHRPVNGNLARLAAGLSIRKDHILGLLTNLCATNANTSIKWPQEKLSFVLGWIVLNASLIEMNTLNSGFLRKKNNMEEIVAYQDTFVMKHRFGKSSPDIGHKETDPSLLLSILARSITRIHTLTPDKKDGREWVIRTVDWQIKNKQKMDKYAEILANPERAKIKSYCEKNVIFIKEDPLIVHNFSYDSISKKNISLYSKGIINGYKAILAAQNYLTGKSTMEPLLKLL